MFCSSLFTYHFAIINTLCYRWLLNGIEGNMPKEPRALVGKRTNKKNEITHYQIDGNSKVTPIETVAKNG